MMKLVDVQVGKTYVINKNNDSRFEVGELVEVIEKGHMSPNWILVKTHNPDTDIASLGGHGTQVVYAEELSEIK